MIREPRVVKVDCEYCDVPLSLEIAHAHDAKMLVECWRCGGNFVVAVTVKLELESLPVSGELRLARDQLEKIGVMPRALKPGDLQK